MWMGLVSLQAHQAIHQDCKVWFGRYLLGLESGTLLRVSANKKDA
jgi:hypothetical protein